MPTKRQRKTHQAVQRITERAVELFIAKDWYELHRELGRKPWEVDLKFAKSPTPTNPHPSEMQITDAKVAYGLRLELESLVKARNGNAKASPA